MIMMPTRSISRISIRPTCPARRAAARLRRAFGRPILAAPPVRAIQVSPLLRSDDRKGRIALNYELKLVYKEKNHWLVLTRTSLAGFNAPIDNLLKRRRPEKYGDKVEHKGAFTLADLAAMAQSDEDS